MADTEVDHPPVQLETDSIHSLGGLADDWTQDETGDINLTDLQHVLVDMGQERELLSSWIDMGVDEISPSSFGLQAEQEREFVRHPWSDDGEHHFTNLQGSAGDSFGEALFLDHEFLETNITNLESTLTLLDFSIDDHIDRFKPPPKSKRRVRFQCPPDPESDNDVEPNSHYSTGRSELELTWAWPNDNLKGDNPYFDPFDQSQSAESDSGNASNSILYGNPGDELDILGASAKESRIECFYCNELFTPSMVNMTNWDYLCPSCIMRLCERPNR